MTKKTGIGLVGLGTIADFHAKAIKESENGELRACCSQSAEKLTEYKKKYSCKGYSSYQELIDDADIDMVSICTPSGLHLDYVIEAANKGKHIMVEKPLEITLERCDEIIEACDKNKVKLGCVFQSRYFGASTLIKGAIEDERFGKLVMGNAYVQWFRSQDYYDSGAWRGTWDMDGGGALMNQSIHAIDLLQWFMGDVVSVQAYVDTRNHQRIDVEDNAVAVLKFKNGALGTIQGSTCVFPGYQKKIEILGTTGSAIMEEDALSAWTFNTETPEDEKIRQQFSLKDTLGGANDPKHIKFEAHRNQFDDFINAIDNNLQYMINGMESRKSVEIIHGIYESARKGKEVSFPLK